MASIPDPYPRTLFKEDPSVPEGFIMFTVGNKKQHEDYLSDGWVESLAPRPYPRLLYKADPLAKDGVRYFTARSAAEEEDGKAKGFGRDVVAAKEQPVAIPPSEQNTPNSGLAARVASLEARLSQVETQLWEPEIPSAVVSKGKK